MDSILKELFGSGDDEPEAAAAAPAAPAAAAAAAPEQPKTERQAALAAQREARREARQQRKADPERQHKRKEFVERYQTGDPSEGFSAEEALDHIKEMREELSPAELRAAMEQTLNHLPADQRDEFIALMRQQKAAHAAARQATGAAPAAGTAAAAAAAGAAAPAADPFGGLLTGLFGGPAGAGGVDAGSVLADLRKGGLSSPQSASGGTPSYEDFTALINSPLGKAVLGGLAAYGMQAAQRGDDEPAGRTRG